MSRSTTTDLGIMAGVFAAVTLLAELAGAPNLGTAMTFGQLGFGAALVFVLTQR